MSKYKKAFVEGLAAIVATIAAYGVGDGSIAQSEWINIAILAIGTFKVYNSPNTPYAQYVKWVSAALTAVLVLLASVITDGITTAEVWQLVAAGLGAVGVLSVSNTDTELDEIRTEIAQS